MGGFRPSVNAGALGVTPAGFGLPAQAQPALSDPMRTAARYSLANPHAGDGFRSTRQAAASAEAAAALAPGAEAAALANNPILLAALLQSLQNPPNGQFNPVLAQQAMQQMGTPSAGAPVAGFTPEEQAVMQMQPEGSPNAAPNNAPNNAIGLPTPAAGGLFSNKDKRQAKSQNEAATLSAEEPPPKLPPVHPLAPIGALAGSGVLAWGANKTFNWAEGKTLLGEGRWTHAAGSPLAKTARTLSHWGPFGWLSQQIEAKVTPEYLKENPAYRDLLLMDEFKGDALWKHRADSRYLQAELNALKTGLDDGNFLTHKLSDARGSARGVEKTAYQLLTQDPDLALDTLLLKAPKNWSNWHKQAYLGQYLKENLATLKEPEFKNILDVVKRELPDLLSEAGTPKNLLTNLGEQEPKALAWLQTQLSNGEGKLFNKVAEAHATGNSALARHFATHLPTLDANPNAARMAVFEPFQKKMKSQMRTTLQLDELVDRIKSTQLQGLRKGYGGNGLSSTPTPEAKKALDKALDKLWIHVKDNPHLEKELIKELGEGNITHAAGLEKFLKSVKKQLKTPVLKEKALLERLEGFFARTNHTLSSHHRHYYNNVALLGKINNDPWNWRWAMAKEVLAEHGVNDERALLKLKSLLKAENNTWATQLRSHLPASMNATAKEAAINALKGVDDVVLNAPQVQGLGRLFVGFNNQLKRMMTGDVVNDFFSGAKVPQFFQGLAAASLFLFPVMETFKADNPMDKVRSFTREFLGNGIGLLFGAGLARSLAGAFALSPKLLKGASSQILGKLPLIGKFSKGGALIEFVLGSIVLGGIFGHVGRVVSDVVLGKPTHIKEQEAYEKRKQAKEEFMKRQALAQSLGAEQAAGGRAGLPYSMPPLAGAAALGANRPQALSGAFSGASGLTPQMIAASRPSTQPAQDSAFLQGLPAVGEAPMGSL